jgi:hypothetical protein
MLLLVLALLPFSKWIYGGYGWRQKSLSALKLSGFAVAMWSRMAAMRLGGS